MPFVMKATLERLRIYFTKLHSGEIQKNNNTNCISFETQLLKKIDKNKQADENIT